MKKSDDQTSDVRQFFAFAADARKRWEMRSLIGVLLSFCGICSKYFSADRDEGKKSASRPESTLFLPISIVILKTSFQIKSNKIYLYAEIKILNNTKMPLFSKAFILKIIPKSDPWFFWKWKIHAIISVSKLYFFSFSIILADYTRMSSFCKRHILRFMLCLSVAIP